MRIDALDHLPVQLQHQAQHTVGGRVLGAEVDGELALVHFARVGGPVVRLVEGDPAQVVDGLGGLQRVSVGHQAFPPEGVPAEPMAFSSPGSTVAGYSAPSHGDRKSKLRNSCVSLTGS